MIRTFQSLAMRELIAHGEAVIDNLTINDVAEIYAIFDINADAAHFKMRGDSLYLVVDRPASIRPTIKGGT